MPALDFIGDIHGYADELDALLQHLGYVNGVHPEGRKAVFIGDYIDRGPQIKRVLHTVRSMVERDSAYALMGNHELNALMYHTPDRRGGFLREHTSFNIRGHEATVTQLGKDIGEWLSWMAELPLWIDFGDCRAVHACWSDAAIAALAGKNHLAYCPLEEVAHHSHPVRLLLEGLELPLPEGVHWHNMAGERRTVIRAKWWLNPVGVRFSDALMPAMPLVGELPEIHLTEESARIFPGFAGTPLFIGHYWLDGPHPAFLTPQICCLDYSVARKGFLCAYQFDGESVLDETKFAFVPR